MSQRRDFQQAIRERQEQADEMEAAHQQAVHGVGWREGVEKVDEEGPEHEDEGLGNDLVEGVLEEGPQPAPEQPLELGHQEKGNEDWPDEHGDAGRDEAERDDGEEHD